MDLPASGQPHLCFLLWGEDFFIPLFGTKNINVLFSTLRPKIKKSVLAVFHLAEWWLKVLISHYLTLLTCNIWGNLAEIQARPVEGSGARLWSHLLVTSKYDKVELVLRLLRG